jgi:hypothetical protein
MGEKKAGQPGNAWPTSLIFFSVLVDDAQGGTGHY